MTPVNENSHCSAWRNRDDPQQDNAIHHDASSSRTVAGFDCRWRLTPRRTNSNGRRPGTDGAKTMSVAEPDENAISTDPFDLQRRRHSEQVRRGMRAAAQRGFYVFANAPYGYRKVAAWDRGLRRYKLELDPPASETVRMIFDLRLAGASMLEITAELNAIDARAPTGGQWRGQHVSRILSNEVYCGTSVAARQDMQDPDTAVLAPNAFPAIVSQEEFDQVQRMRGTVGS